MVLVNTLTVEAINTALIALQRGQSIVVGGEKPGTTVNNITISNGGGSGGGSSLDFTPQITALDKRVGLLEKAEELLRQENERQNERLDALEGLGITDFYFDDTSRELTIELANGEVFDTEVTSESFSMDVVNGELVIRIGEQVHTVTLPMGSQADWTQTDSTQPDFIKHKIPIWITQGSADDNMSPIDSVTDGSMRPVTSNAVAGALNGYGNNISYISQQALNGLNSYFATVGNYQSFDYATTDGVEYRAIGFKHTNYGTAIAFTRGYILGLYFSGNAVTKQRVLFNMN